MIFVLASHESENSTDVRTIESCKSQLVMNLLVIQHKVEFFETDSNLSLISHGGNIQPGKTGKELKKRHQPQPPTASDFSVVLFTATTTVCIDKT